MDQKLKEIIIGYFGVSEYELSFNDLCNFHMNLGDAIEIAKQYADQKLDEAAENVTLKIERNGKQIFKGNYAFIAEDMDHIQIDKQSILKLKNQI